jgi:small subunit ribosomal protein S5
MQPAAEGNASRRAMAVVAVRGDGVTISRRSAMVPPTYNVVRATLDGLLQQHRPSEIAAKRGKKVEEIVG